MAAKNASRGTPGHPTKDAPTRRGRDARKGAHDDGRTATQSNPPVHHVPTFGPSRFLYEVPPDTPLDELGELYERWQDDTEQTDLKGWDE